MPSLTDPRSFASTSSAPSTLERAGGDRKPGPHHSVPSPLPRPTSRVPGSRAEFAARLPVERPTPAAWRLRRSGPPPGGRRDAETPAGRDPHEIAQRLLHRSFETLSTYEQEVIRRIAGRLHISRNVRAEHEEQLTFGQRLADRVAAFGGSWTFILIFGAILAAWIVLNSIVLAKAHESFDPYPYILLNLILSTLAALQAPVIMMSQNRQAAKDRLEAAHDYEVNLKAELEIMGLHQKLDDLRQQQWTELLSLQQDQIHALERILGEIARLTASGGRAG